MAEWDEQTIANEVEWATRCADGLNAAVTILRAGADSPELSASVRRECAASLARLDLDD